MKNKKEANKKSKDYYENNKSIIKNKGRIYYENNRDKKLDYQKQYQSNNKDKRNEREKLRKKNDIVYKLRSKVSKMTHQILKRRGQIKSKSSLEMVGCDCEFLLKYIESKFENWMNWDNYGLYNGELNYGWDIDHIIPLSVGKNEEEIYTLSHYLNLQPLDSKINRDIKRDKI